MKTYERIGIFDSGVGGLSVWREIRRQIPHAPTLYLADQAHVPYGTRSLEEVRAFSEHITQFLLEQGAAMIVIACNTASAAALYYLRERFPDIPFVGMEPAVKPALEQTRTGVVGVIATEATFQGELFANLIGRYGNGGQVLTRACPGLVAAVESGALEGKETLELLKNYLSPLIASGADQLVLGCTHYPFLRESIEQVVQGRMAVIDPAPSVARQAARVLATAAPDLNGTTTPDPAHVFYTTGTADILAGVIQRLLPPFKNHPPVVYPLRWQEGALRFTSSEGV